MNAPVNNARRQILQMLSSVPMLPLSSALGGSALLAACGGGEDGVIPRSGTVATLDSVSFSSMAAPDLGNPAAMATTAVDSIMTTHFSDGSQVDFELAYQPFFITGDMVAKLGGGTILAGGYVDIHGNPIMDKSVPGSERQFFSDCPDGSSLLAIDKAHVAGCKGKTVFAVVQFEYTTMDQSGVSMYGKLPSPIAVLTLDQDPATGKLSLVKYHNVDTSGVHGLWITCGASLSPWGTHLSSEEYEPDAVNIAGNAQFKAFIENLYGDSTASSDAVKANPYLYGHLPEVTVKHDGTGSIAKHYCLGRISHELVQVMPDHRTVLMGDDATNGGLFVFVADKKKNLSSGSLYVAKVGAPGVSLDTTAAAAPLSWIKLGSATSDEVKAMAETLTAADILTVSKTDPGDASYTKIYFNGGNEWVKILPGMERAAAFLETHRYASYLGASMGFTKMEGTTVNIADKVAYSALSACRDSMVVGGKGNDTSNGIALSKAVKAGAVMALPMAGGVKDTGGAAIDSEWMPTGIQALVVGEDMPADSLGNTAVVDKIANPDNLKYSERMRTLFIGEDSGMHVNNFLWAYHIDTHQLSRVLSCPAGAESTGLHAVDDIHGWTYIMSNFQHAGDAMPAAIAATLEPLIDANYKDKFGAAVGYLTANPKQPDLQDRKKPKAKGR